jgi:hypothetical protein
MVPSPKEHLLGYWALKEGTLYLTGRKVTVVILG